MKRTTAIAIVLLMAAVGCDMSPSVTAKPARERLLGLASDEAQQITDPTERLTRQLNFADQQIDDGDGTEAYQSLTHAAETLKTAGAEKLSARIRVAGWISVSELSRRNKNQQPAEAACDEAVKTLRELPSPPERAQFVVGVSNEVLALHGKDASAKLLAESSDWTHQIEPTATRRVAITEIADAIFKCDDYTAGMNVLRTDADAAWRSDTLKQLADERGGRQMDWISNVGNGAVPGSIAANPADYPTAESRVSGGKELQFPPTSPAGGIEALRVGGYQKSVDFQSVFKR